MNDIIFSIIMPTYNSESTIKIALESIKVQNFDLNKVEVLVIDGGSKDKTLDIAKQYYFVKIFKNEKRLPEYAKLIGFQSALGKYIIKWDSDEVATDKNMLQNRFRALQENPKVKILVVDKMRIPRKKNRLYISSNYANLIGDPFTFFMYRTKNSIYKTFKNFIEKETDKVVLFNFKNTDYRPIADSGTTTLDMNYVRENIDIKRIENIISISDKILNLTGLCLLIKNETIEHHSFCGFKRYVQKIKFRVIENIMNPESSGFSSREVSSKKKKFLFPFYTISFMFPLIDGIYLSFENKDITLLLHVAYSYITLFYICKYMLYKIFNKKIINDKY